MPGKSAPPARSFTMRLSRTSWCTLRWGTAPLSTARRRPPSVEIVEGFDIIRILVPFFDRDSPMVVAHRGGCALGPENTIVAFDRGIAAGADALELDVHLSADGIAVVCHDDTLARTTS